MNTTRLLAICLIALLTLPLALAKVPVVAITLVPSTPNGTNGWYNSTVGINYTCYDPEKTAVTLVFWVDNHVPETSNANVSRSESGSGAHVANLFCRDSNTTIESAATNKSFKIDALPPSVTAGGPLFGPTGTTVAQFWHYTISDSGSGLSGTAIISYSTNQTDPLANPWTTLYSTPISGATFSDSFPVPDVSTPGLLCFRIQMQDAAGNSVKTKLGAPLLTPSVPTHCTVGT